MELGAADNLTGRTVIGERSGQRWTIGQKMTYAEGVSPGHHSVGYCATSDGGTKAFVKATDLRMAGIGTAGFLQRLKAKIDAHAFERTLLDRANGARMDKVVVVLDYGSVELQHEAALYSVLFLVFEFAEEGDLRRHIKIEHSLDLVDLLSIAHNITNAVSQLHSGTISHNDIKPGNCLVFHKALQKLGDLGRATSESIEAPHGILLAAGDPQYAPPEQLYDLYNDTLDMEMVKARKLGDIFGLGSIIYYLLTARMITPELLRRLDQQYRPLRYGGQWTGTYYEVLPFVRSVWVTLFAELRSKVETGPLKGIFGELISLAEKASDPDPRKRGVFVNGKQTLSLQHFLSRFDNLRRKAAVTIRAS